jgi:uncharacterized protein
MSVTTLRPWIDLVPLHPDVEAGLLTEAVYAIDLGAIADRDSNVPDVYREPEPFFRATYLTSDLRKMLAEVLAALAGQAGINRVLKLRTPFGGGKSHTLATLLHAARSRPALDVIPEGKGLADPGEVRVAVFDGEKFGAREGKAVPDGPHVRTMWGWLAWQIGPEAYALVEGNDQDRVAPGGDLIKEMLTKGAGGRPVLLLLDEVLKYMERAAGIGVLESTLQRQAKDFFQNLTVEVSGSKHAAMVYSLQWSKKEALGNIALLQEIDMLANRVDQLREPVTGDEVLPILQRRLLGGKPAPDVATHVAAAYEEIVTKMRRAHALDASQRQQADEEGYRLRERLRDAYPFHPALIDVMRERWTALDHFQRTRGALRLLASCPHSLKQKGGARPLLGPGEVPLKDPGVRLAILKELGVQNDYDPVITADIDGPEARARRIDDRLARETPALSSVRPATRLATAILMYSFGGLRRDGSEGGEALPPGVTEGELLAACVGPDLDNITATAVLAELRTACLYLHHDGVRYAFKKDPNVTKLIEDAEGEVARNPEEVKSRIKEMLTRRLAGHSEAFLWPESSQRIDDKEPRFLVGYLPLEFADQPRPEQDRLAVEMFSKYGDRPRSYRNGIGLAIPDKAQVEPLRRAVRYLMAIDRVESKKEQLRLTKDQAGQLAERRKTEEGAAESAFRALYPSVWLPKVEDGGLGIERVEVGGRPLQATGIHQRVMELLTNPGSPRVHATVTPRKIVERLRLGESPAPGEPPRLGLRASEVQDAFFSFLSPPRLESSAAIRQALVRGIAEGVFAYTSGAAPSLGPDGRFQVAREKVTLGQTIPEDEVDFESGFLMMPSAVPAPAPPVQPGAGGHSTGGTDSTGSSTEVAGAIEGSGLATTVVRDRKPQTVRWKFAADRNQIFKIFQSLANLADQADGGKVDFQVEATREVGFDPAWLRNAVEEPLDEAGVESL